MSRLLCACCAINTRQSLNEGMDLSRHDSNRYSPEAAHFLCKCSDWAYLPVNDAYAEFASCGYDMQRYTAGSLTVDIATDGMSTVVSFAGTNDVSDWLVNLNVDKADWHGFQLHEGFHEGEQELFYKLADHYGPDLSNVWITGHSLGGALATLHALRFADGHGSECLKGVYTFGSPRCMDHRSADMCDLLMRSRHWRIVNGNDIFPRVPIWLRFKHCGQHIRINRYGNIVHRPTPLGTLIDRVLGYRADLITNHFVDKYILPLTRHIQ